MLERFFNEIANNILAVSLILIVLFLCAKFSKRIRHFVLPVLFGTVGASFITILLNKNSLISVSANLYFIFYNYLSVLLDFVKELNFTLEAILVNVLSLTGLLKLLAMANLHQVSFNSIQLSIDALLLNFVSNIKVDDYEEKNLKINFDFNKNLHTPFIEHKAVFNC